MQYFCLYPKRLLVFSLFRQSRLPRQVWGMMSHSLSNKNVLLGVTGGIAAYKSAELIRLLVKSGAKVQVVMTTGAKSFITPLTMQALSGLAVKDDLFNAESENAMGHIELARWADIIVIAPASADFIATLASGRADSLLATLCLATKAPVKVCPAMNHQMWSHGATKANIQQLKDYGYDIWGPAEGEQACGEVGAGRMEEPETINALVEESFSKGPLSGHRCLITAGPTQEAICPVRYISNHSSGKMGYALAEVAAALGATVTLISGPVKLMTPRGVKRIDVISALEMFEAAKAHIKGHDIFISVAAVSDYYYPDAATHKMKKSDEELTLKLRKTPDIVSYIKRQYPETFVVGFAAETQDLLLYAEKKRQQKSLDMVVANQIDLENNPFDANDNRVTILGESGTRSLIKADKRVVARQIIAEMIKNMSLTQEETLSVN